MDNKDAAMVYAENMIRRENPDGMNYEELATAYQRHVDAAQRMSCAEKTPSAQTLAYSVAHQYCAGVIGMLLSGDAQTVDEARPLALTRGHKIA